MRFTNYKFHSLFILHDPSAETSNIIESLIYQDLEVWLDRINLTQETTTTLKSINFVTNNVHDKVYMNEVGRAIDAVVQPSAPTASLLPPRASSRVKPARIPRCHVEVLFIVARERPVSEPSSVFFFLLILGRLSPRVITSVLSAAVKGRAHGSIRVTRDAERTARRANRDTAAIFQITPRPLSDALLQDHGPLSNTHRRLCKVTDLTRA